MTARYVVIGAGAIGGTIGGRLAVTGHDVVLVARGAHGEAIRADGLLLREPEREARVAVTCVAAPDEVSWRNGDVVVLATKVHQADAALGAVAAAAPTVVPVLCATNGLAAERMALRRFPTVYGVLVNLPAEHLTPGVVSAYSAPLGVLDLGRYPPGGDGGRSHPPGRDALAAAIATDLVAAGFSSRVEADIMRRKRSKLLVNLSNVLQAACGADADVRDLRDAARAEAEDVLRAAGLERSTDEEERARREESGVRMQPIAGQARGGGSTWQSLARAGGDTEADFLNGEVVLLGRLHGVPTPVNAMLQALARELAAAGARPGSLPPDALRARARSIALDR